MIAYNPESALFVMDWVTKFKQLRCREKQSDWYGKRGLSWHISMTICSEPEKAGSLDSLINFAVCSGAEHTLQKIKGQEPHVS